MEPCVFDLGSHVSFFKEGKLSAKTTAILSLLPNSLWHNEIWYSSLGVSKTVALCPMRIQGCFIDSKNERKLLNASSLGRVSRITPCFDKHLFPSLLYATRKPWTAVADVAISNVGVIQDENEERLETAANCKISQFYVSTCCLHVKIDYAINLIVNRFPYVNNSGAPRAREARAERSTNG